MSQVEPGNLAQTSVINSFILHWAGFVQVFLFYLSCIVWALLPMYVYRGGLLKRSPPVKYVRKFKNRPKSRSRPNHPPAMSLTVGKVPPSFSVFSFEMYKVGQKA